MNRACRILFLVITVLFIAIGGGHSRAQADEVIALDSYKDELFRYRTPLEERWDGAYRLIPFDKQIDEYGRDQVGKVLQFALPQYVDESVSRAHQRATVVQDKPRGRRLETFEVASPRRARFAVIFVHGGSREQGSLGIQDWRFGGNFNRLKNLVVLNGGVYYSPTVSLEFTPRDAENLGALVEAIHGESPRIPVIMACASSGGRMCSMFAHQSSVGGRLAGIMYVGSAADGDLSQSPAARARIPIYFLHGAEDKNASAEGQYQQFLRLRQRTSGYPTQFILFATGAHGTPLRMIDWRESLNWIFAHQAR